MHTSIRFKRRALWRTVASPETISPTPPSSTARPSRSGAPSMVIWTSELPAGKLWRRPATSGWSSIFHPAGGAAGWRPLADAPGQRVFGKLFTLAGEDWPIVQHKEGAITGMCVEREVDVIVDGVPVKAVAFITAPGRRNLDGPVSPRFMEALERGARAAGLPEAYLDELRRLP